MSVNSKMTAIADAIRAKTGGTAALTLDGMASAVASIPEKIDTSGTAVPADIYTGKTATVNDVKLTGSNPYNAEIVDPQVTSMLAALAEKGVDTSGKGLADIAGLIASIEAGGGVGNITLPSNVKAIAVDSLVLASAKQEFAAYHSLNERPSYMLLLPNDVFYLSSSSTGYKSMTHFAIALGYTTGTFKVMQPLTGNVGYNSSYIGSMNKKNTETNLTETSGRFFGPNSNHFDAGEYMVLSVKLYNESNEGA